jgi:hypothetical protein
MRSTKFPRYTCRLVAGIVMGGACILSPVVGFAEPVADQPANAATNDTDTTSTTASDAAVPARAGQWIHVDPQTGRRVAPPAPSTAIPLAHPAFSTSHQGLVERPSPGGGVMVDLQGRFRSGATAAIGPDGKPVLDCIAPGTATHEAKP